MISVPIEERKSQEQFIGGKGVRCTYSIIIRNLYMRIFNIIGAYTRAVSLLFNFKADNGIDIYLQMLGVGREAGYVVKILYGFEPSQRDIDTLLEVV